VLFLLKYWKYIAGVLAIIALLGAVRHNGYNSGYDKGATTIQAQWDKDKRLQEAAIQRARDDAQKVKEQNEKLAKEIENVLRPAIDAATADGLGLSERLRNYQARFASCSRNLSAATGAASGTAQPAAGEPDNSSAVGEAADQHFAACARDAARLKGWQDWYAAVSQ